MLLSAVALFLAVSVFAEEKPLQLKDLKDKASYSLGLNYGMNFKTQNIDLNADAFAAGFKDGTNGKKPLLTVEEVKATLTAFQPEIQTKQQAMAQKNAAEGEKFLAENKTKEGLKTTASG